MAIATLDPGASTRERQALWGRPGSQPLYAQTTTQQGQCVGTVTYQSNSTVRPSGEVFNAPWSGRVMASLPLPQMALWDEALCLPRSERDGSTACLARRFIALRMVSAGRLPFSPELETVVGWRSRYGLVWTLGRRRTIA
jgi:hypothetical protein